MFHEQVSRTQPSIDTLPFMPTWESAANRGSRRASHLLRRVGQELRTIRIGAGLSTRHVAKLIGVSHTHVRRIESGVASHIDIDLLARMASALGAELSLNVHPVGPPVRDNAHVALLGRFAARLHPSITWRTEVPMPIPGDLRSADGVARISGATAAENGPTVIVEAETRLDDVQAVERRIRAKQRDLGADRAILLVADTRHNRAVIDGTPALREAFPIGTRACMAALGRGVDLGGDCLVVL